MKLSSYRFQVPNNLIASYPTKKRDGARMMVVDLKKKKISHHLFKDFTQFFKAGDVIVKNNIYVPHWKLYGYKEKNLSKIEVCLLRELNGEPYLWDATIDPARKIRIGNKLFFGKSSFDLPMLVAEVLDNTTSRGRTIRFLYDGPPEELNARIEEIGAPPIPSHLGRAPEKIDWERYQTVFAEPLKGEMKSPGAGVVPDGSLFFTEYILKYLELKDVLLPNIKLYTHQETIEPLGIQDLGRYQIGSEYYEVGAEAAEAVNNARKNKKQICAVGCGTFKALESSLDSNNHVRVSSGWTNRFIYPFYESHTATALLTYFHLPGSPQSLAALAFGAVNGQTDFIMHAYQEAIKQKYRFFVYGDALLIKQ